ncbi:MAG TPA: FAD-dependent oxidoreductase [Candidatus Acidoferrales bacterium]|nr:FAD-dependent oxidoreductase [Candidatus Acidoferrales bacterium]
MKVAVVGAGVIGLATACELARRGVEVSLIGDRPAGAGASSSNAGWICPALAGPVPGPGLIPRAARWMLRPDSPVYVRPSLEPAFLAFLWRMARACNARSHAAGFAATAALGAGTREAFDRWAADGLAFEMHETGVIEVFRDPAELRHAVSGPSRPVVLSGAEARVRIPALSAEVVGAVLHPDERSVDPRSLVAALKRRIGELGVASIHGAVTAARVEQGGRVTLAGVFGELDADAVIVAAGAWTGRVAALFGASLPVRPGKGYSLDFPAGAGPVALPMPVMLAEPHCVLTPLDGGLRLAGTMEFGGFDERVSATRVRAIRRAPTRYLTGWRADAPSAAPVAGLRPMTPDGLPIIGRLGAAPSVVIASGHAMLGLTLAPRTAELVADILVEGADPPVLRPFSPARFGA